MIRGSFTQAEDDRLRELRVSGETIEATAAIMNRAVGSVSNRICILGIGGQDAEGAQRSADARFQAALARAFVRGEFPGAAA